MQDTGSGDVASLTWPNSVTCICEIQRTLPNLHEKVCTLSAQIGRKGTFKASNSMIAYKNGWENRRHTGEKRESSRASGGCRIGKGLRAWMRKCGGLWIR